MAKNEDGEFELILGNRQLLSVFFIVVILLGVFFTMGYIVGRNSAPLAPEIATRQDSKPLVVDPGQRQQEPPAEAPVAAPKPKPAEVEKPAPPPKEEPVKAEPPKPPKPAPPPPAAPPATSGEPASGETYLQLAATSKREADIMVDVLRQKSFRAMAAEIPARPGTFRVLVGPLTGENVNKTRADLQGAGFPGNAAIKRTF